MKEIRMVQSRPYNPKAQGKVEWSHRVLRNKLYFDKVTQTWSGTNWVKNLPNYMKYLNIEKREELGWRSPFEVYFGRKRNELVRCGLPRNRSSQEVRKVSKPTKNDFNMFKKLLSKTRKRALHSDERVAKRTIEYSRKRNKCSVHKINQKVLVTYGTRLLHIT